MGVIVSMDSSSWVTQNCPVVDRLFGATVCCGIERSGRRAVFVGRRKGLRAARPNVSMTGRRQDVRFGCDRERVPSRCVRVASQR